MRGLDGWREEYEEEEIGRRRERRWRKGEVRRFGDGERGKVKRKN
jgi:hypothetical protein